MSGKFPGGFVTASAPAGFSVAFDGTGDYLSIADNAAFAFGANPCTIEFWFYPTLGSTSQYIFDQNNNVSGNSSFQFWLNTSNVLNCALFSSTTEYGINSSALSLNQWYHVALVRSGVNLSAFINGVRIGTLGTLSTNVINDSTAEVRIGNLGNSPTNSFPFQGYVSNARIVKGTAVYDPTATTINVPTQLFPVSGTSLLTCQSPTLIDNSTNNFTITANGDAKVSNFTPFAAYQGFNPALGAAAGGVWTLDEAAYYQNNRQWPIYDPYFKNTTLMLHGNGTNAAQNNTFLDSSTNNFTITRNGNTTQGSFSPFSQTGWSTFFNGSTDYLLGGTNAAYTFGTGDLTIELWMWATTTTGGQGLIGFGGAVPGVATLFINAASGTANIRFNASSGTSVTTGNNAWSPNQWNHIAVSRASGVTRIFVNGALQVSASQTDNLGGADISIGRAYYNLNQEYFSGYLSNIRVIKGTALYTGNFTPSTQPLNVVTNTVLLTCQDNRFVDDSANNFTLTANGTPSVQAFSPFVPAYITPTTYSNKFDGTGDSLTLASNAAFTFGTGDFTIEAWVYNTNSSTGRFVLYSTNSPGTSGGLTIFQESTSLIYFRIDGGNDLTTTAPSINAWNHIAVTRASGTVRIFVNGILNTSATRAQDVTQNTPYIGDFPTGSYSLNGCMSNLRVLKGTALYTAAFTPPTAPLTNITNTSLLTCQSSTFIDNSTNNFTITATGNVKPVTSPTPFPANVDTTTLNSAYSTSLIGGGGYFDGSGDYLSCGSQSAYAFGTGNFTFEAWVYVPNRDAQYNIAATRASAGTVNGWNINITTSGGIVVFTDAFVFNNVGTVPINAWTHIAFTREGTGTNQTKIYINGVNVASATNSQDFSNTTLGVGNANDGSQYPFLGYISGVRLIKGTARYTSNFAPPVAPLTNVTNTSLLLNYTNGAIFDNTAKNVLETVGNAQISTTQSKYGGSSMYCPTTNGNYFVSPPNQQNFLFGTGQFTVEAWVYPLAFTNTASGAFGYGLSGGYVDWNLEISTAGAVLYIDNDAGRFTSSSNLSANVWTHLCVVRTSTAVTMYFNGVSVGTYSTINNISGSSTSARLYVGTGAQVPGSRQFVGYIDDLRITKGVARYTTNFTPPTSQLQDQ